MNLLSFESVENLSFDFLEAERHKTWLSALVSLHSKRIGEVQYMFCDARYMWQLNKKFLDHDTDTDIITFDSSCADIISGEIYISIDRVKENAEKYKTLFSQELRRVMSHGVLHLIGYKDDSPQNKKCMQEQEDIAIRMYDKIDRNVPRGT